MTSPNSAMFLHSTRCALCLHASKHQARQAVCCSCQLSGRIRVATFCRSTNLHALLWLYRHYRIILQNRMLSDASCVFIAHVSSRKEVPLSSAVCNLGCFLGCCALQQPQNCDLLASCNASLSRPGKGVFKYQVITMVKTLQYIVYIPYAV